MKAITSIETCGRDFYWDGRKLRPTAPTYIQFIIRRDRRLYGLEQGKAIRLLGKLRTTYPDESVRTNASLLLQEILKGREIFDEYPLLCEFARREQSRPICIHEVVAAELDFATKLGRDD